MAIARKMVVGWILHHYEAECTEYFSPSALKKGKKEGQLTQVSIKDGPSLMLWDSAVQIVPNTWLKYASPAFYDNLRTHIDGNRRVQENDSETSEG